MQTHAVTVALSVVALVATLGIVEARAADPTRGRNVALGGASAVSPRSACHTCHGMTGDGDSSGAFPRLTGQAAWYLYKQLKDYASGARQNDVMSPIARALDDAQMQDVAAYYSSQTTSAAGPAFGADPLLLQRGGAISATGLQDKAVAACVNCHGPGGKGLPPSFPYLAGQYTPYIMLQFKLWRDGARRNDPLGVMQHIARQLSEEDMRAVAAYFASLPPPGGAAPTQ